MKWYWWTAIGIGGLTLITLPSIAFANKNKFDLIINDASKDLQVPKRYIKGIIATESSFRPSVKASTSSATGLMQPTRAAAIDAGFGGQDLTDPRINIYTGTTYLRQLYDRFGSWNSAIRAYYQGAGNELKGVNSPRWDEAQAYLNKVKLYALAFTVKEPWTVI